MLRLGSCQVARDCTQFTIPTLCRQVTDSVSQTYSQYTPSVSHLPSSICPPSIPDPDDLTVVPKPTKMRRTQSSAPKLVRADCTSFSDSSVIDNINKSCIVCFLQEIQVMYISCHHACVCKECATKINSCPLCRKPVDKIKELNVRSRCTECYKEGANMLYLPCSHVVVCDTCINKKHVECSICNTLIEKVIKIF